MKNLSLHILLFLFLSLLRSTTIFSNEYHAIITQPLYTNNPQQLATPMLTKAQERTHARLHNSRNAHKPQANYPTQGQFNTVLSWMNQLYPSTIPCAPTQQLPKSPEIKKDFLQTYDHKNIIKRRNDVIEQLNNGNISINTQTYTLSPVTNEYCNVHDIDTKTLQLCTGNIVQQILHNEFVEITQHSAMIWSNKEYKQITNQFSSILADFTDAGITFNHAQEIKKAISLADSCWAILDCIQAIGEGIAQGVYTTIDEIIHPIRTAQNILDSIATCGYCIGTLTLEIGELGYIVFAEHPDNTYQKLHIWADNFEIIHKALQEKCATLKTRDIIKEAVAFGTQCYATTKALRGISTLFKNARNHALKIIQQASQTTNATVLTTPEGIVIRIADNSVECMKNNKNIPTACTAKNTAIPEFIRDNRVPIDKETILSCSSFEKTKITPVKGAQIYKKNQQFYHRDTLHKGKGAHLEVYNKNGKHLGEADPISGKLIQNTQDKTKHLTL